MIVFSEIIGLVGSGHALAIQSHQLVE